MTLEEITDLDFVHKPNNRSIYVRSDYIVNSDMSAPLALATTFVYGIHSEAGIHPGFVIPDRRPQPSPLVGHSLHLPFPKR